MARGKKFTAAEKHFADRQVKFTKEIADLRILVKSLCTERDNALLDKQKFEAENLQLRDWIERLLDYTQLSEEDIKKACQRDKAAATAIDGLLTLFALGDTVGFFRGAESVLSM